MAETDQEREKRATELAYAQGRREADVDSHLRSHEKRLNAINGSIERAAANSKKLEETVDRNHKELAEKIGEISEQLATREAVEADRVQQIKDANEKQISRRDMWLGVATICAMVLIGLYAKSKGVG